MEKKLIPELRFPEFSGEWDKKKLSDILNVKHGKSQRDVECIDGSYPILGTGGIIGQSKIPIYTEESVLIGRKGTIDKPIYMSTPFWTIDTLFYTEINFKKTNPFWLYIKFININWYKYNEASGVPSLSAKTISNIDILIPSLPEQEKIGDFFFKLDEKIELQRNYVEKLKDKKKGLMQRIFSREVKFKDENSEDYPEWEEKKLGEVSDIRDGTHDSPKYIGSEGNMFITSKNLLSNGKIDFEDVSYISDEDFDQINKRSKVETGDILFGMIGTIGNPVLILNDNFAIKNVALIKEKNDLLNKYLVYFLDSEYIDRQFYILNTGGSQKFIGLGIIRELLIPIPSLQEQDKIANILSKVDEKIELEVNLLEKYEDMKKGLMQKIFI